MSNCVVESVLIVQEFTNYYFCYILKVPFISVPAVPIKRLQACGSVARPNERISQQINACFSIFVPLSQNIKSVDNQSSLGHPTFHKNREHPVSNTLPGDLEALRAKRHCLKLSPFLRHSPKLLDLF